jgi:hypothetical protein
VRLDKLTVRLELDPRSYDDPTLASLWASRIREALLAANRAALATGLASATPASGAPATPPETATRTDSPLAQEATVMTARRAITGDRNASTELARIVVTDPHGVARLLWPELSAAERRRLIRAVEGSDARGGRRRSRVGLDLRLGPPPLARQSSVAPHKVGRPLGQLRSWARSLESSSRRLLARTQPATGRRKFAPSADVGRVAAIRGARVPAHDPFLVSKVGGLAFLWPWLAAHLDAATARLPRIDPRHARRLALAGLVPELAGGVDDPMVRLLAGDELADKPSLIVVTSAELHLAGNGAKDVLEAFTAAIPGFAGSTPEFVRREFIERPGLVDTQTDPVSVRLAPVPLDPALSRLPYPIGLFQLPWTRPIAVHVEAG